MTHGYGLVGYGPCKLCGTGRVLKTEVCRDCENSADPNTMHGAVILAYMEADRCCDDSSLWLTITELLRPFALSSEGRLPEPVELYMRLFAARNDFQGLATRSALAGLRKKPLMDRTTEDEMGELLAFCFDHLSPEHQDMVETALAKKAAMIR